MLAPPLIVDDADVDTILERLAGAVDLLTVR
jgi:acetylornithine/succinyldiaminopimelate/putrescine aminotransferase